MSNQSDVLGKSSHGLHGGIDVKGHTNAEAAKLDYLYAFAYHFRKLCPRGFTDGMWTNAHMHFGIGKLDPEAAAIHFWNEIKPSA